MTAIKNHAALDAIRDLLGADLVGGLLNAFAMIDWAEEEIQQAQGRHPGKADELFHAFMVLTPSDELLGTEFVVRSHCRELLDRVAAGQDTRPPTAAEMASVCCEMSQRAPLTTAGMTVYMRVWQRAFPDKAIFEKDAEHYEHIASSGADAMERSMVGKLTKPDRMLKPETCNGRHWDKTVPCKFMPVEEEAA